MNTPSPDDRYTRLLMPMLSAGLFAAAAPTLSLWPLAFVALVPLFHSMYHAGKIRGAAFAGFVFGGVLFTLLAHWLYTATVDHYGKPPWIGVAFMLLCGVLPYGLLFAAFGAAFRALRQDSAVFFALVVPSLWILAEYVTTLVPVMIPWGMAGYLAAPFSLYTQAADVAGVWGVSFTLVAANGCLLMATRSRPGVAVTLAIIFIAGPAVYGLHATSRVEALMAAKKGTADEKAATLVQASHSLKERWSGMGFSHRLRTYMEMSDCAPAPGGCTVVWAETVLNQPGEVNRTLFARLAGFVSDDSVLIAGAVRKKGDRTFNSAYVVTGQGSVSRYDKNILLPYSETPLFFDFLGDFYTAPDRFDPGDAPSAVTTSHGTYGLSICFEGVYPNYVRRSVSNGAGVLVNISNDSWFGRTSMPHAHLNAVRFRAIENRRYMLRTSNSGFSAVISPTGAVLARSGLFTRETVRHRYAVLRTPSTYTRFGDWAPLVAILLLLAATGFAVLGKNSVARGRDRG
ncbi:MAG: apolipoprotein N-acyltransferase [Desulfatibacillaceae bacterium]